MSIQGRKYTYYVEEVQGNTARKLRPEPIPVKSVSKKKTVRFLKNRDKARYMNLGYVLFLVCALLISGLTLTTYLGLQSEITTSIKHISSLERELNNLRLANDENHSRIINNVDLDYIRRVAIQELRMVYAKEGQIIDFVGNRGDYVRQLNPLP